LGGGGGGQAPQTWVFANAPDPPNLTSPPNRVGRGGRGSCGVK